MPRSAKIADKKSEATVAIFVEIMHGKWLGKKIVVNKYLLNNFFSVELPIIINFALSY